MGGRKWLEPNTSGGFQVSLLHFYLRPCLIILEGGWCLGSWTYYLEVESSSFTPCYILAKCWTSEPNHAIFSSLV